MIQSQPFPLGSTFHPGGVNFSVFSKDCKSLELLLFERSEDLAPCRTIVLDPRRDRTFDYWHVFVRGLGPGQIYAYRAHGPFKPQRGQRFDGRKVLLDPYGLAVTAPVGYLREAASRPGDAGYNPVKSVVANLATYDWKGDAPLMRPFSQTVIYELHVRGFTQHSSSGVAPERRGTFSGLIERIPYLSNLGITAVELLPVFQFDEQDAPEGLVNYWGYSPMSFFAPHSRYSSNGDPLGALDEFRDMVKALHLAGIEVILDVVYNHTAEGDHTGPTLSLRGLANDVYYILNEDKATYPNYTGTGNTLNANHAVVRRMILDSLHHWVADMHVDGFRFDLASILSRDESGHPLANPPILWDIESDPVLAGTKLIAEAWDAAGLYQVGNFGSERWKEWNGKFRDDVRSFVRGDRGTVSRLPNRLLASPDLYGRGSGGPEQSINFVTCHDGFTLNDLVSYNRKHNTANKHRSRDGADDNLGWNCGAEGATADPAILELRSRQIKNFLTITLLAMGTPMLSMGDEVRRTQRGNNNPYCQDNEITWIDWKASESQGGLRRFVQQLIQFRGNLDMVARDHGLSLARFLHESRIQWHGVRLNEPDWGDDSHSLAFSAQNLSGTRLMYCILNSFWEYLDFELPVVAVGQYGGWRRVIDTSLAPPGDFCEPKVAPAVSGANYLAGPRSVVVLVARIARGH